MGGPIESLLGKLRIMAKQGFGIILLAVILAVLGNTVRPRALPLFAPPLWKQVVGSSRQALTIEEAEHLFLCNKAVFIDARSPELYAEGHIRGARNIPEGSGEGLLEGALADLAMGSVLIVYCDDETSAMSVSLSRKLAAVDRARKIRTLLRGWDLWVANELPIESGAGPVEEEG